MPFKYLRTMVVVGLTTTTLQAHAGASLYVDDAAITPEGSCQAESWVRSYSSGERELTTVPACTYAGTEVSLDISDYPRSTQDPQLTLGIKRVLYDADNDNWGISASLNTTWDGAHGDVDGWTFNLPTSFALDSAHDTLLHADVGWSKQSQLAGRPTFGLGIESALDARWTLLAEAYADQSNLVEGGVRRQIGQNASLDLLVGHQGGGSGSNWITLGFNTLLSH